MNVRCAAHVDFGGSCRNDATWTYSGSVGPAFCDDCRLLDDKTAVRVGITPRIPRSLFYPGHVRGGDA